MGYRLGIDVGGTFTDLLLFHEETGRIWRAKTPSTPADQSVGVLNGINQVCERASIHKDAIDSIIHGTTVGTNAVLEGKAQSLNEVVEAVAAPSSDEYVEENGAA